MKFWTWSMMLGFFYSIKRWFLFQFYWEIFWTIHVLSVFLINITFNLSGQLQSEGMCDVLRISSINTCISPEISLLRIWKLFLTVYKVAESTFPHKDKAKLSSDEILKLEVPYTINLLKHGRSLMDTDHSSEGEDEDEDQVLIPISRLMNFSTISKIVDEDSLRWPFNLLIC